jgi:hypothetical protein
MVSFLSWLGIWFLLAQVQYTQPGLFSLLFLPPFFSFFTADIGKSSWKACYLEIEDIEACNTRTGFRIIPVTAPSIKEWLDFFKANGFNLYLDQIRK